MADAAGIDSFEDKTAAQAIAAGYIKEDGTVEMIYKNTITTTSTAAYDATNGFVDGVAVPSAATYGLDNTADLYYFNGNVGKAITYAKYTELHTLKGDGANTGVSVADHGTLTLKNAYDKDIVGSYKDAEWDMVIQNNITVNGDELKYDFGAPLVIDAVKKDINGGASFTGSYTNDKAVTTSGNDKFNLGTGLNTIVLDKVFGKDEVTLTKGEELVIDTATVKNPLTGANDPLARVNTTPDGNDLKVTVIAKDTVKSMVSKTYTTTEMTPADFTITSTYVAKGSTLVAGKATTYKDEVDAWKAAHDGAEPADDDTLYTIAKSYDAENTKWTVTGVTQAGAAENLVVKYTIKDGETFVVTDKTEAQTDLISAGNPETIYKNVKDVTSYAWTPAKKAFVATEHDAGSGTTYATAPVASTFTYNGANAITQAKLAEIAAITGEDGVANKNVVVRDYGSVTLLNAAAGDVLGERGIVAYDLTGVPVSVVEGSKGAAVYPTEATGVTKTMEANKAGKAAFKGSAANDYVVTSKGDDTISAAKGSNTIYIDASAKFGNDTINLIKGEKTQLQFHKLAVGANQIVASVKGSDIIYTVYDKDVTGGLAGAKELGSVKIKGLAGSEKTNSFSVAGYTAALPLVDVLNVWDASADVYTTKMEANKSGKATFVGGYLSDEVIATAADDTISAKKGINTVVIDASKAFGNDSVNIIKEETTTLQFKGLAVGANQFVKSVSGNDILITVYDKDVTGGLAGAKELGTVKVKGLAGKRTSDSISVEGYTAAAPAVDVFAGAILDLTTQVYTATLDQDAKKYNGKYLNETVTVGAAGKVNSNNLTLSLGDGRNVADLTFASGKNKINAGTGNDTIIGGTGDDTYKLGKGLDTIRIADATKAFGDDVVNLTKGERVRINLGTIAANLVKFEKDGNDLVVKVLKTAGGTDANGTIRLKNYVKDPSVADVKFSIDNGVSYNEPNRAALAGRLVEITAGKGTTAGTIFDDAVTSANDKNTFQSTYTADGFGNDTIKSSKEATDVLKYTAAAKVDKLLGDDFDFALSGDKKTLTVTADSLDSSTTYNYTDNSVLNLDNISFVDAKSNKYQFAYEDVAANGEVDLSKKTNNIVFLKSAGKTTVNDEIKNDVVIGDNQQTIFNYKGGFDKYVGGIADDTYNVTFGKKTSVTVADNGSAIADVLDIQADTKSNAYKSFGESSLGVYVNITATGTMGSDVVLFEKAAYKKGATFVNALLNDKLNGGMIEIDDFYTEGTGTGVKAKGVGEIETIKVNSSAKTTINIDGTVDALSANVVGWLNAKGIYADTDAVFESGNAKDIQSLLNLYTGAETATITAP
jgi:hypothetical protein